jgi:hypothetical protein
MASHLNRERTEYPACRSFGLDVACPDYFGPLFRFGSLKLPKFVGRHWHRRTAEFGKTPAMGALSRRKSKGSFSYNVALTRLLRAPRQRPRGRAAEQRDELAAPHVDFPRLAVRACRPVRRCPSGNPSSNAFWRNAPGELIRPRLFGPLRNKLRDLIRVAIHHHHVAVSLNPERRVHDHCGLPPLPHIPGDNSPERP